VTTGEQLAAFAKADASKPFDVEIDGVSFRVLVLGERNEHVSLVAPYAPRAVAGQPQRTGPRPMRIVLARESARDREAKRTGVSREVQTGDAEFDELVYVRTDTADELTLAVLGASELRRAACTLLRAGFHEIVLDDESTHITAWCPRSCSAGAEEIAHAFAAIVSHVPAVQISTRVRSRSWPAAVGLGLIVGVPIVIACALLAVAWYWVPVATVAGGAAGVGFGLLIGRTQRGRSDSHVRRQVLAGASLLGGVLIGNLAALYVLDAVAWIAYAAITVVIAIVGVVLALR
jgi:hypothetical protein